MGNLRTVKVSWLKPAAYNPRSIDQEARDGLDHSLRTLGMIRPIVATENGLLLAGHQRTESAKRLGITDVPAWVMPCMEDHAEVRFNQLHNAGDLDCQKSEIHIRGLQGGNHSYQPQAINVVHFDKHYALQYVCKMLNKYGQFGAAVVDKDGLVLSGHVYAMACKLLRLPLLAYRVPQSVSSRDARRMLTAQYGRFDYTNAPKETWNQAHAQPTRRGCSSDLFRRFVMPLIQKKHRILDYGCGAGLHYQTLRRMGYRANGWEPYPRLDTNTLDLHGYQENMITLCCDVGLNGLWDVVTCDSVLNSVDSKQAEQDVCLAIRCLTRPGGMAIISGRNRETHDKIVDGSRKVTTPTRRKTEFLDDHGFTAVPGKGAGWTYQLFHTKDQATALCRLIGGANGAVVDFYCNSYTWQAVVKRDTAPAGEIEMAALKRELSLPWPEPQRNPPSGENLIRLVAEKIGLAAAG